MFLFLTVKDINSLYKQEAVVMAITSESPQRSQSYVSKLFSLGSPVNLYFH